MGRGTLRFGAAESCGYRACLNDVCVYACVVAAVLADMITLASTSRVSAALETRFAEMMNGKKEDSGQNVFAQCDSTNQRLCKDFADKWRGRQQEFVESLKNSYFDVDCKSAAAVLGEISLISPSSAAAVCLQMDDDIALDLLVCMRAQRYEDEAVLREMKQGAAERLDESSAGHMEKLLKKKQGDFVLRSGNNLLGTLLKEGDPVLYQGVQHNFYSVVTGVKFPSPNWEAPQTHINVSFTWMIACYLVCCIPEALTANTLRQINMMPFNMADLSSLPANLRGYWPVRVARMRARGRYLPPSK